MEVRKVIAAHPKRPIRSWVGGYRYLRPSGKCVVLECTEGIYEGLEACFPAEDVRPVGSPSKSAP